MICRSRPRCSSEESGVQELGKRIAILGDIHANIDALNVVLDDCRRYGVTDYLCVGDVVGYNAAPSECLKIVRDLGCPVVKGNHDDYISATDKSLSDFNPSAAAVIEWTRGQLTGEELAWLKDLPFSVTKMGMTIVHSTMDNPENFGYVFENVQAEASFIYQKVPLCFHGHTHCPMIFERSLNGVFRIDPSELQNGAFKLVPGRKYFINVGSVGQPRDLNPLSSYVIYDPVAKTVYFRRLPYDIAAAQAKIRAAGLPERLAARLEVGQ